MDLVLVFDSGCQIGPLIDEVIVSAAVRVSLQKQCRLIDAIDDAVSGNVLGSTRQPGEGGEEIRLVNHIASDLPRFDHARPKCGGTHAHSTLGEIALATTEKTLPKACSRRRMVGHRPVVSHRDDQSILGDAKILQRRSKLLDVGLDHTVVVLTNHTSLKCGLLRLVG